MTSTGGFRKRSPARPMNYVFHATLVLLLFEVLTDKYASACAEGQECLSLKECRRVQKQNSIQPFPIPTLLFPCDESLIVMTICCTVQKKAGGLVVEENPGYNITYGDLDISESIQAGVSSPELIPLPLKEPIPEQFPEVQEQFPDAPEQLPEVPEQLPEVPDTEACGLFKRGDNSEGDAVEGQFPWLALVGKCDNATGEFLVDCGGTLIDRRYVLTSAQCLDQLQKPPEIVRLGEYDRSIGNQQINGFPQHYGIEKIIVHESFNYPFLKNDIALLKLDPCVAEFSDRIRPICLPEAASDESSAEYVMAGWRAHGTFGVPASEIPKFGPLSKNNSGICDLPIPVQPVGEAQICFGSNPSSCYGDFGGPLTEYIKTGTMEQAVQVGLFTYGGKRCGARFSGELYTKVFPYRDWIIEKMKD